MAILIMCSNAECGELLDVPEEAVGKKVRCPGCGTVQTAASCSPCNAAASSAPMSASVPADTEKPAEKPARDPADEGAIDLTQFDEWVSADAPASPNPPPETPVRVNAADDSVVDLTVLGLLSADEVPTGAKEPPHEPAPEAAPATAAPATATAPSAETSCATIEKPQPAPEGGIAAAEPLDDLPAVQETATRSAGEGVLESKAAVCSILVMGVIGILGGAAAGFFIFRGHPIAGIYAGGALGWVAGFMVACLFVLSAERAGDKVRCQDCGKFFPEGTEFCDSCGADLAGPSINPIARGGLHAGSYGLGGKPAILFMALLGLVGGGIAEEIHQAAGQPSYFDGWGWAPTSLAALVLACLGGYLLEYLLSAVRQTLRMDGKTPSLPSPLSMRSLRAAAGAVAVVCVYVVPLVTLPLLPPAMLYLATAGMGKALNVKRTLTVALRRSADFTILWLVVFLWVGGLLLSLALAVAVFVGMDRLPSLLDAANPAWASPIRSALWVVLTAVKSAIVWAIVCIFGLAIARCIGLFGRKN